jgi:hypothetical protein
MPGRGRPFQKGVPRHPNAGRKKGVPSQTAISCKDSILEVFKRLGGVDGMAAWAQDNPGEFYSRIYAKLLPKQVDVDHSGSVGGSFKVYIGFDPVKDI